MNQNNFLCVTKWQKIAISQTFTPSIFQNFKHKYSEANNTYRSLHYSNFFSSRRVGLSCNSCCDIFVDTTPRVDMTRHNITKVTRWRQHRSYQSSRIVLQEERDSGWKKYFPLSCFKHFNLFNVCETQGGHPMHLIDKKRSCGTPNRTVVGWTTGLACHFRFNYFWSTSTLIILE